MCQKVRNTRSWLLFINTCQRYFTKATLNTSHCSRRQGKKWTKPIQKVMDLHSGTEWWRKKNHLNSTFGEKKGWKLLTSTMASAARQQQLSEEQNREIIFAGGGGLVIKMDKSSSPLEQNLFCYSGLINIRRQLYRYLCEDLAREKNCTFWRLTKAGKLLFIGAKSLCWKRGAWKNVSAKGFSCIKITPQLGVWKYHFTRQLKEKYLRSIS